MRIAAKQGDAVAQYNLGVAYATGEGIAQDKREAVRWYRKAAEQGHAWAQNNLGLAYGFGEGVIQDYKESYIWLSIAKVFGNKDSADSFRNTNWQNYLSKAEISDAKSETKKRLEKIEADMGG